MSNISAEEVDYGSFDIVENPNLKERPWSSLDSMNGPREKSPPTIQKARNSGNTSKSSVPKRKRIKQLFFGGSTKTIQEKKKREKKQKTN
jgi:hypothetical protein